MFGIGTTELLVILAIAMLLFGARRLPELGSGLGRAIKNFKAGMKEEEETAEQPAHQQVPPPAGTATSTAAAATSSAFGNGRDQRV